MSNLARYIIFSLLLLVVVGVFIVNKREQREQQVLVKTLENAASVRDVTFEQVFSLLDSLIMNHEKVSYFEQNLKLLNHDSISRSTLMAVSEFFSESDSIARESGDIVIELKNDIQLLASTEYDVSSLQNLLIKLETEQIEQRARVKAIRDTLLSLSVKGTGVHDIMTMIDLQANPFGRSYDVNKGYYVMGTHIDLLRAGIIKRKYLLFGESFIKDSADLDDFNIIGIRSSRRLYIGKRNVELISSHPKGSYHFNMNDSIVKEIVIDNPEQFWAESKVLVIVYKN